MSHVEQPHFNTSQQVVQKASFHRREAISFRVNWFGAETGFISSISSQSLEKSVGSKGTLQPEKARQDLNPWRASEGVTIDN